MRLTMLEHNGCDGGLTMTHARSSGAPAQERAEHERLEKWMSAAAALAVGGAFFALWFWLLPGWLGFRVETAGAARWDGWRRFHRCWDSQLLCAAFGTSGGRDAEPLRPSLRLSD